MASQPMSWNGELRAVVYEALHRSRGQCLARGHDWDVADVMAALADLGCW